MDNVTMEELIMQRTLSNLLLFSMFLNLAQGLAVVKLVTYPFKFLAREDPTRWTIAIMVFNIIAFYHIYPLIHLQPLYAARGDATKCLDLLRLETLNGPIKPCYSCTFGSCTAILRLGLSHLAIADHAAAAAERGVSQLARSVDTVYFMGTARMSSSSGYSAEDMVEDDYASLHCTKSWGGIARWIAELQLGNSIGNRTQEIA